MFFRNKNLIIITFSIIIALSSNLLSMKQFIAFKPSIDRYENKLNIDEKYKINELVHFLSKKRVIQNGCFSDINLLNIIKYEFPDDTVKENNRKLFYLSYSLLDRLNRKINNFVYGSSSRTLKGIVPTEQNNIRSNDLSRVSLKNIYKIGTIIIILNGLINKYYKTM